MGRSFRDRSPLVVGFFSLLTLGALLAGAVAIGTFDVLEDSYTTAGLFDSAGGIEEGDEVRMAGVKIGSVTSVEPDFETGEMRVEWKILSGHDVSADSDAHISLLTLTGQKYLRIVSPGGAPYLHELPLSERVIPRSRTEVPSEVPEVLNSASRTLASVDAEGLDGVLEDVADVLDGKGETLEAMLDDLGSVAAVLNERDDELTGLLTSIDDVAAALASKDQTLVELIDTSERVLRVLADRRDDLARALGEGADAVVELSRLIAENRRTIDAILDDLHRATGAVSRQQDDLDEGLTTASLGLEQLGHIGDSGPWLDTIAQGVPPDFLVTLAEVYPAFGDFLDTYETVLGGDG